MTRTNFTIIFMVICGLILLLLVNYDHMDLVGKFSYISIYIAYIVGQYSTKFPKEKE